MVEDLTFHMKFKGKDLTLPLSIQSLELHRSWVTGLLMPTQAYKQLSVDSHRDFSFVIKEYSSVT